MHQFQGPNVKSLGQLVERPKRYVLFGTFNGTDVRPVQVGSRPQFLLRPSAPLPQASYRRSNDLIGWRLLHACQNDAMMVIALQSISSISNQRSDDELPYGKDDET